MTALLIIIGWLSLVGWLYLALIHGRFWFPLLSEPAIEPESWPSVDVIVPARNEAELLPVTLTSLLSQDYPGQCHIILVDDHSTDGTGDVAKRAVAKKNMNEALSVVAAPDLPKGWTGKVAAMQAGVEQSTAEYILFTDADIYHSANNLRQLIERATEKKLDLVSLMVKLHCQTVAEKLLIPAFVFFFAMLYPFTRVNDPDSPVAAAAGGVMLIKRKALENIGGLASIKSALIDDCTLAKAIKNFGGEGQRAGRVELTMTRLVKSLRIYETIGDIWRMVSRTAFTQLRYSGKFLIGTILGMGLLFVAPVLLPTSSSLTAAVLGMTTWFLMTILYLPMIRFYNLPIVWAIALPAAAVIFVGATIDSARLYWQGKGGQWKGRAQA